MLTEEVLEGLRAEHGDVQVAEFLTDDDTTFSVALRRPRCDRYDPKVDEFLKYWTLRAAIEMAPQRVDDPTNDGTRELLACVVFPDPMRVREHLADYPGDAAQLRDDFNDLAGSAQIAHAPDLITEEVKAKFHKRAVAFRAGGRPVVARPMTAAEHATFLTKNGGQMFPLRAEALCWVAWSCVREMPDRETKRKPEFDALLSEFPILGVVVGIALINKAQSRVVDRAKKSETP